MVTRSGMGPFYRSSSAGSGDGSRRHGEERHAMSETSRRLLVDLKKGGFEGGPRHFYTGDSFTVSYLKSAGWTPSFTSTVSPGSSTPLGPAEMIIEPPLLRTALGTQLDVSVVLTVVEPLCPPAATRVSPTAVPATSERPTFSGGPGDQVFEPGS